MKKKIILLKIEYWWLPTFLWLKVDYTCTSNYIFMGLTLTVILLKKKDYGRIYTCVMCLHKYFSIYVGYNWFLVYSENWDLVYFWILNWTSWLEQKSFFNFNEI